MSSAIEHGVGLNPSDDVQVDSAGDPVGPYGAHAMLMVRYDRPNKYFIFKNSYGTASGHNGYTFLSYCCVQYAWYGFVVTN